MGGTDDPDNLVELTVEEHAEAHRKLYEKYGHMQDLIMWKGVSEITKFGMLSDDQRRAIKRIAGTWRSTTILKENHSG